LHHAIQNSSAVWSACPKAINPTTGFWRALSRKVNWQSIIQTCTTFFMRSERTSMMDVSKWTAYVGAQKLEHLRTACKSGRYQR